MYPKAISTMKDEIALGITTTEPNAILIRIECFAQSDFFMLEIVSFNFLLNLLGSLDFDFFEKNSP